MSIKVNLYHATHCPPCREYLKEGGSWDKLQKLCKEEKLQVVFKKFDMDDDNDKLFNEKNIAVTPTIEIIVDGERIKHDEREPNMLFDIIKSGGVIQSGGCGCAQPQRGGGDNEMYYRKYLKYKAKYMALQNL